MAAESASGRERGDDPARDARMPRQVPPAGSTRRARRRDQAAARDSRARGSAQPGARDRQARASAQPSARDSRAHAFTQGGVLDTAAPCAALTCVLDEISGPDRLAAATTDDELIGLLGRWDAEESWCASAKLGVIRALIRRRPAAGSGARPGGLPTAWHQELTSEVALELAISMRAADALVGLAWHLEARLPKTAAALDAGILSFIKAKIIADHTGVLDDEHAAAAEALVAARWVGKTPSQIAALIARAVIKVDPDGARKRREQAERENARVEFWREHAGTAAIAAFGLPSDEALEANQHIQDHALALKAAGYPGTMDLLRARAWLDMINGTDSRPQPAPADPSTATGGPDATHGTTGNQGGDGTGGTNARDRGHGPAGSGDGGNSRSGNGGSDSENGVSENGVSENGVSENGVFENGVFENGVFENGDGGNGGPGNGPSGNGPSGNGRSGNGNGGNGSPGNGGMHGPAGTGGGAAAGGAGAGLAAKINLTIPLATLLGLAGNPGEAHGLGPVDPELARHLAAAAAGNDRSTWCVTVTDEQGHAIGHGCARPAKGSRAKRGKPGSGTGNRDGPAFTADNDHGPPGGYGTWDLNLAGGREFRVKLAPIPVTGCDHRLESRGYQPSGTLRHLVEVRDGTCDFPPCVRTAHRCDFEHAIPYDKGGRTCACNAGPRCRRDHKVKQSRGWDVRQPLPGYHQWITPAGRAYPTEPMRYPD